MNTLKIIMSILIGAIIGYCTNYIAIKMLFRPKKEVKIGGFKLPFTPGIIPKNKGRIAKAVSSAVATQLFTSDDLKNTFLSENMKNTISQSINKKLMESDKKFSDIFINEVGLEKYEVFKDKVSFELTNKIKNSILKIDIASILVNEGSDILKTKLQGSMMAMFINDDMIASFAKPLATGIDNYVNEHGDEILKPLVVEEIDNITNKSAKDLFIKLNLNEDIIGNIIGNAYEKIIVEKIDKVVHHINIAEVVEDKINAMNVDEIESLVMSVMKNELQAVINLGALIGAIIGIINILF